MTDLDALRWVETADVYKGEVRAASLTRTAQGTRFAYRDEYAGPAVATTLPLGTVVELAGGARACVLQWPVARGTQAHSLTWRHQDIPR